MKINKTNKVFKKKASKTNLKLGWQKLENKNGLQKNSAIHPPPKGRGFLAQDR